MTEKAKKKRLLTAIQRYITFFLLMAFVVTCCMMVFLNLFERNMEIIFTKDNLKTSATLTFLNVILLSLICTVIDGIRRKIMVAKPVKRIINATEKIIDGDFSARIEQVNSIYTADGFDIIIDRLNKMAEELSGIETLRTDFIANVSHEIKTPLAVIQNYGTMLQQPDLSVEKRLEYAKTVTESSRRLADLITNILKLNRLENQQIYPEKKVYNLGEQLCECLLNFESTWEEKEIEIDTDIEEKVFVESDVELLTLIWNNLFSNAMKFTEHGGNVYLKLHSDGEWAVVEVSDTGCGISQEVGRHIFEKFYQGDTSHATQGNGLGLALVKRVVDIVGGDISVNSELGKGSTFTVKIRRKHDGEFKTDS
ncbi:MAG: HAMP domain-containing histidine kinase [Muribaculaceae bacterium]|nr:HAMP domain-containing histidine kinase [Muribaculaceae bacterium]